VGEVGQDVVAAPLQGPSEGGEFVEAGRDRRAQVVDHAGEQCLAFAGIGVGVGGDDLLVDQPGHLDWGVGVVGEHRLEAGLLAGGEQRGAGAQGAAGAVERVTGSAAMAGGVLLDVLSAQVELGPG
jgi:hypothetical protein